MKSFFVALLLIFNCFFCFSQVSVSVTSLNLSSGVGSQYDNLVSGTDTFFVVPIVLDSFITDIISFQCNIIYNPNLVKPLLDSNGVPDVVNVNSLLFSSFNTIPVSMVAESVISSDTFSIFNGLEMLSVICTDTSLFTSLNYKIGEVTYSIYLYK